jgi:hypothetical protein
MIKIIIVLFFLSGRRKANNNSTIFFPWEEKATTRKGHAETHHVNDFKHHPSQYVPAWSPALEHV